jgi:hypothetical protein
MSAAAVDMAPVRARLAANIEALSHLAQSESFGVERLFAGLFVSTYRRLVLYLDTRGEADFAYLTVLRFFDLYQDYVAGPAMGGADAASPQWRRYGALVRRLDMTSPISAHLWLISLGARAHTRHDLAEAAWLAAGDYRRLHGRDPDLAAARPMLLGRATSDAFFAAALEFIDMHRSQRRGWRRWVLTLYAFGIRLSRPLWLGVFQAWRRAAWRDATRWLAAGPADRPWKEGAAVRAVA